MIFLQIVSYLSLKISFWQLVHYFRGFSQVTLDYIHVSICVVAHQAIYLWFSLFWAATNNQLPEHKETCVSVIRMHVHSFRNYMFTLLEL